MKQKQERKQEQLSKEELLALFEVLAHRLNIQRACYEPVRDFLLHNINRDWKTVNVRKMLSSSDLKKTTSQKVMQSFCVWFYAERELVEAYFASFSIEEQKLFQEATWTQSVPWQRINQLFGRTAVGCEKTGQRYGNSFSFNLDQKLERWKDFTLCTQIWYAKDVKEFLAKTQLHFELPLALRLSFANALPKPDGYELKPYRLKKNETVFTAEEAIFRELPLIVTHHLQGNIRHTQKGYPVTSSCKKMHKALQISEFPGNDEPALRTVLLAGSLFGQINMETAATAPLHVLEGLFNDEQEHCSIPILLDYLKGARSLYPSECDEEATQKVLDICSLMNSTDWISLENINTYLRTHFIDFEPVPSYYVSKLRYEDGPREVPLQRKDMEERINGPALAAHFYWLAAFGVMELAIDCDDPCRYSWYDGLRACRLTALGAHLFGMQKEYTPPKSNSEVKLTFDEHNLVIVAEGNLALADTMLHHYAVRAGDNHYQFSPGKFLKDCRSESDLKNKIDLFKRTVGGTLPPFWESSLKRIRQNSRAISPKKDMRIYELPAGDKEQHRLVAQDPQLRPFIIKAEKFHVLVAESDASRFTERMKELGYLIG